MLYESGLLPNLRRVAHYNDQPVMQAYNKDMSAVRVSVEWMFGNLTKYFSFVDFKRQIKVHLSAVGKMYAVSALLENARTCLYSNIVSKTFDLQPPTLDQ